MLQALRSTSTVNVYRAALKMATKSTKQAVVFAPWNVDSSMMNEADAYAQLNMATKLHRWVNVLLNHEHQVVHRTKNVLTINSVCSKRKRAKTLASTKCAVLMHCVMQPITKPFANVSPATPEIQKFSAVSHQSLYIRFLFHFFFMLDHIFMIIIGNFQIIQTSALNHLPSQTCWSAVWLMVLRPKST